MQNLKSNLQSILFIASKPLSTKALAKYLDAEEAAVRDALAELQQEHAQSGIVLLAANDSWQLATHSENTEAVKNFMSSELREKLTDATVEVLAIIAYKQPVSKMEIEAIRGVNSQYSVRSLLMRGLIERIPNPSDARSYLYQITTEFLQHMGITSVKDLPEFEKLVEKIKLPETVKLETSSPETPPEAPATQPQE
jgi:segregation and condensation protein B